MGLTQISFVAFDSGEEKTVKNFGRGEPCREKSILISELLFVEHRIADEGAAVKLLPVHIDCINAAAVVGCVVVYASVCVPAGGVYRDLIFAFSDLAAAALLIDRAENMEELVYALLFRVSGD